MARRVPGALWRSTAIAVLASASAIPVGSSPAAAADPDGLTVLAPESMTATTLDLDGDGANEIVRILDVDGPGFVVDAWTWTPSRWDRLDPTLLVPRDTDGRASTVPDADVAALLNWRRDGTKRPLAITATSDTTDFSTVCCLSFREVRRAGQRTELVEIPNEAAATDAAPSIRAVDFDGDGTDELITLASLYDEATETGTLHLEVLRLVDGRFVSIYELEQPDNGFGVVAGESDGVPGEDLLLGPDQFGEIMRLAWRDGSLRREDGHLELEFDFGGWLVGIAGGRLFVQGGDGVRFATWPAGAAIEDDGPRVRVFGDRSLYLVGSGDDALLVVTAPGYAPLSSSSAPFAVYDVDLELVREFDLSFPSSIWTFIDRASRRGFPIDDAPLYPWMGPVPDAEGRLSAFAGFGALLEPDGAGGAQVSSFSPLIGASIVGRAGPGGAWAVLGDSFFFGAQSEAYLFPGNSFSQALWTVPFDRLIEPDPDFFELELDRAVALERTDDLVRVAAGPDSFWAVVSAEPGTTVAMWDGILSSADTVSDGSVRLELRPRRAPPNKNQEFENEVMVVAPDGRARIVRIEGTFIREQPQIDTSAVTNDFALAATVRGRVSAGTTVTVDGRPVTTDGSGAFHAEVDAPFWPRDVVVVVRDVLGNEATERLEVVGFLDYRGLPWVPIIGVLTLAAGAFLFVRTPARRIEPVVEMSDATLEEIDGDLA